MDEGELGWGWQQVGEGVSKGVGKGGQGKVRLAWDHSTLRSGSWYAPSDAPVKGARRALVGWAAPG